MLSVLRKLAAGQDKLAVCKEANYSLAYLNRCLNHPLIRDEYTRLCKLVEAEYVTQAASTQSGLSTPMQTALTAEVDASILEAIQRLRHIMNNSNSDQAKALAAKELLDLGQAKKRLALLDKGLEDGVEVSPDDISLLASTITDCRQLHLIYLGKDGRNKKLPDTITEAEIADALPDELSGSTPNDAPSEGPDITNVAEISPTAALGNGRGEGGPKLAPVIGSVGTPIGPTIDDMLGGVPPTP